METLFEFIIVFVIFFAVKYAAYWLTEVKGMPEWLQYKPWTCNLCLSFWTLVFTYVAIWVSFSCLIVGIFGNLLAVMNAAAMWIDQKERTVKIEDFDKIIGDNLGN